MTGPLCAASVTLVHYMSRPGDDLLRRPRGSRREALA
jgi:hypothetical protein